MASMLSHANRQLIESELWPIFPHSSPWIQKRLSQFVSQSTMDQVIFSAAKAAAAESTSTQR